MIKIIKIENHLQGYGFLPGVWEQYCPEWTRYRCRILSETFVPNGEYHVAELSKRYPGSIQTRIPKGTLIRKVEIFNCVFIVFRHAAHNRPTTPMGAYDTYESAKDAIAPLAQQEGNPIEKYYIKEVPHYETKPLT